MASSFRSPLGRIISRHAERLVSTAMTDTRVVLVNGARQCGKSTLVQVVSADRGADWLSLDRPVVRQAAAQDPSGFIAERETMVIDEIQRVPELLLAIKEEVDAEFRPGRFLLTGSARVLGLRALPDALVGRMETIELWPFSQGEIDGTRDRFVDEVFARGPRLRHDSTAARSEYARRLTRGGFPEAVARPDRRRDRFFDAYVADLINRDVIQLTEIERGDGMRALVRLLAARSGQLLRPDALASDAGLPTRTVRRYLALLEEVFLIKRIPAWSRNLSTRATATPKVAFVDSGVAANLCDVDAPGLTQPGGPFGPLLESFVLMELARQLTWSDERAELYHYRTRDKVEVDAILENRRGRVVAIEVKASSTVRAEDFRGIRHLADRLGDDFVVGLVLYTGTQTLPFGPRLRAMPVSALWQVGA